MALFDGGMNSLEDVLGQQADTQRMDVQNQFAKKRRQTISQQAKAGRLGSGVANYSLADVDAEELGAMGDVESGLAQALGQVPLNDFRTQQEANRKLELSRLLGKMNKPSALEQAFGAVGGIGNLAMTARGAGMF